MKKACLVVDDAFCGNRIFNADDPALNRDNCLDPYIRLREAFRARGYELSTYDITAPEEAEIVLYNDMPRRLPPLRAASKSYLMLFESKVIKPDNFDYRKHRHFNKIFTWADNLVDGVKYFKTNFSSSFDEQYSLERKRTKFSAMICGNKHYNHPNELYSERRKIIKWFEVNAPELMDLYGRGWDRKCFTGKLTKQLNRFKSFKYELSPPLNFKGSVSSKNDLLQGYKFNFCLENAYGFEGYITEKIIDSIKAGAIPIYWGASNIDSHVPEAAFIDYSKFENIPNLLSFLTKLKEEDLEKYYQQMESFLNSSLREQFESQKFASDVVREVLND